MLVGTVWYTYMCGAMWTGVRPLVNRDVRGFGNRCLRKKRPSWQCITAHHPTPSPKVQCWVLCPGGIFGQRKKRPFSAHLSSAENIQHWITGCGVVAWRTVASFRMGVFFADTGIEHASIKNGFGVLADTGIEHLGESRIWLLHRPRLVPK